MGRNLRAEGEERTKKSPPKTAPGVPFPLIEVRAGLGDLPLRSCTVETWWVQKRWGGDARYPWVPNRSQLPVHRWLTRVVHSDALVHTHRVTSR